MARRLLAKLKMGASYGRTWTTVAENGQQTRSVVSLGGADPGDRQTTATWNAVEGTTVTDVRKVDDEKWVGTVTRKPWLFGLFSASTTPVEYPTLHSQLNRVQTNDEMLTLLETSPDWMREDKESAAFEYFKQHPPTAADRIQLKQILKEEKYNAVMAKLYDFRNVQ